MQTVQVVYRSGPVHALRLACFAVGVLIFCVCAAGSMSLVWMRQGIAESARAVKAYERDLAEANRMRAHLQAQIAREEQPENLKRRTSATLWVPKGRQVVYVAPSQVLRTRPEFNYEPTKWAFEIAYNPSPSAQSRAARAN